MSNWLLNAIQIFAPGASGEAPPAAVIAGDRTGLARLKGIAVDAAGKIWVVSFDTVAYRSRILVFSPVASGNAAPAVVIEGDRTELDADPSAIAVDEGGRLYVVDGSGILVFPPGAAGNAAPTRWIAGPHTGLATPVALAF